MSSYDLIKLRKLLGFLADGKPYGLDVLTQELEVNKVQLEKIIADLPEIGLELKKNQGDEFALSHKIELLNCHKIRSELSEDNLPRLSELEVLNFIHSTNQYLLDKKATTKGDVVFAECQFDGRGRHSRKWISPYGANLYFSLEWRFNKSTSLSGLSLAVGTMIVSALKKHGLENLSLKWPNDVYCEGKKLSGVLIEIAKSDTNETRVVIGIGLNVNMPSVCSDKITQPWTDVYSALGEQPSRNRLAGLLLNELLCKLPIYESKGLAEFKDDWQRHDHLLNKKLILQTPTAEVAGISKGIDENGCLLIDSSGELHRIHSGEVVVRMNE